MHGREGKKKKKNCIPSHHGKESHLEGIFNGNRSKNHSND